MRGKVGPWLNSLSIRNRLALLFGVVSIIPVFVIGMVSLRVSNENLLEKAVQDSLNRLGFIQYRTVELMREKHHASLTTAFNEYVRAYFDADTNGYFDNPAVVEDQVKRQVMRLFNKQEDTSVSLLGLDGSGLAYGAAQQSSSVIRIQDSAHAAPDPAQFALFDRWGDVSRENDELVIPYERLVLALSDNRPVARLIVNVKESLFRDFYHDYEQDGHANFFIVNAAGSIFSCSDEALIGQNAWAALDIDPSKLDTDSGHFQQDGYVVGFARDQRRGLWFFERTPASFIYASIGPIVRMTVLVALLCIMVCVVLGSVLAHSLSKPLYSLIDRVSRFDAPSSGAPRGAVKNEIAILSDKYGNILERLETVISEYYDEQQKKKEAQIRALEFQINPHFLYNTLSTIVWLIEADEGKTAISVTKDLSQFFRISISKGREFIALRDEVRHVALYIAIQKARYQDSIFVDYELDDDVLDLLTPKLVLQPLVENSIIHAMQTSKAKTCSIRVRAWREGDDVLMEVRDNGDTITQQTIENMNRFLYHRDEVDSKSDFGIGISNVHDRIAMSFGEGYGLSYRREDGETVARLRIQVLKGGEANV